MSSDRDIGYAIDYFKSAMNLILKLEKEVEALKSKVEELSNK